MSLKMFHTIFIICSILLCFGFGLWSYELYETQNDPTYLCTAIGAVVAAVGLIIYKVIFIKKVKS